MKPPSTNPILLVLLFLVGTGWMAKAQNDYRASLKTSTAFKKSTNDGKLFYFILGD
jgi:hypothetical protein